MARPRERGFNATLTNMRALGAPTVSIVALLGIAAGTSQANNFVGPTNKRLTFSFTSLAPNTSGDRDAAGTVIFEPSNGGVVTVNYAFDNSRTLNNLDVCTVYGTIIAS